MVNKYQAKNIDVRLYKTNYASANHKDRFNVFVKVNDRLLPKRSRSFETQKKAKDYVAEVKKKLREMKR